MFHVRHQSDRDIYAKALHQGRELVGELLLVGVSDQTLALARQQPDML